jgi:hypothetical protein
MKIPEPNRLLQESNSQLERALLGAGAATPSSSQMRAKTLAALGIAAGSATLLSGAAAGAASASLSTAAKLTWTKLVLGVSLVGAAVVPTGYYIANHQTSPASAAARVQAAVRGQAAAAPGGESIDEMMEAPAAVPVDAAARASLTRELAALDHARLALAGGDARRALGALDDHARKFPRGRLALEAEVLRIDALAKLGRTADARQHAETFLRLHPNSVLATRVRTHLQ